jgi:hypothetical protein
LYSAAFSEDRNVDELLKFFNVIFSARECEAIGHEPQNQTDGNSKKKLSKRVLNQNGFRNNHC